MAEYEKTGLDRFAKFDPSVSRTRIAHQVHLPSWRSVYIRLVFRGEYQAAKLIKSRNEEKDTRHSTI